MFPLTIPAVELWDEGKQEFVVINEQKLQLEHSLVSISKWESTWCKPFISTADKTYEETIDYIKCMTITQNVDPRAYGFIRDEDIKEINTYIDSPRTATTFSNEKKGTSNREVVTSELIYWWMVALNIPFECQKWHLNRLLTLIRICNIKNSPQKKMSKKEIMSRNTALNAARRKKHNTKG